MDVFTRKKIGLRILGRALAWNALHDVAAALGFGVASYREPARVEDMRAVRKAKKRRGMNVTPLEANQLIKLVQATGKLGGCMAEVGVYRGGSARLIREADGSRPLHLFDTFEGLPDPGEIDTVVRWNGWFQKGQFLCSLENVRKYLGDCYGLYFHQGLFPGTGEAVRGERFSFVHSDVDLYSSTRSVLEFFYPRLVPGGIIVSHDFATASGPRQAIEEFFRERPEPVIELPGDQAIVIKL
jgi:hypothetical protein